MTAASRSPLERLARRIFATLPSPHLLHLDAEDPTLVESLVALGVDARGHVAASRPATCLAPERVTSGSTAAFGDRAFSIVVRVARADADDQNFAAARLAHQPGRVDRDGTSAGNWCRRRVSR